MKLLGCVCLVSGTAIGAGMLALPIVLAKFGLIFSTVLMVLTWFICYLSALLNLELNLRCETGLPIGKLAEKFSGKKSGFFGSFSLLMLCYSLLCAYIYGGASAISSIDNFPFSISYTALFYAAALMMAMLLSIRKIDILNRFLFLGKVLVTLIILFVALFYIDVDNLPLKTQQPINLKDLNIVLPIVFTSFGFHVVFHTLVKQTNKNAELLKKAFFWGSFVPLVLYLVWTLIICGFIYKNFPDLFQKMLFSSLEVGELLQALCDLSNSYFMQKLTWFIGFFAVLTSTIGVCLGLIDALKECNEVFKKHFLAVIFAIVPSLFVAVIVPNAFIKALSFAGMILSFMAILLPVYLLIVSNRKGLYKNYNYKILKNFSVLLIVFCYGLLIIFSEIKNILG